MLARESHMDGGDDAAVKRATPEKLCFFLRIDAIVEKDRTLHSAGGWAQWRVHHAACLTSALSAPPRETERGTLGAQLATVLTEQSVAPIRSSRRVAGYAEEAR